MLWSKWRWCCRAGLKNVPTKNEPSSPPCFALWWKTSLQLSHRIVYTRRGRGESIPTVMLKRFLRKTCYFTVFDIFDILVHGWHLAGTANCASPTQLIYIFFKLYCATLEKFRFQDLRWELAGTCWLPICVAQIFN